jgi:hypothetical protein
MQHYDLATIKTATCPANQKRARAIGIPERARFNA